MVVADYIAGLRASALLLPPDERRAEFFICASVLAAALLVVCRLKGERPRWQWSGM